MKRGKNSQSAFIFSSTNHRKRRQFMWECKNDEWELPIYGFAHEQIHEQQILENMQHLYAFIFDTVYRIFESIKSSKWISNTIHHYRISIVCGNRNHETFSKRGRLERFTKNLSKPNLDKVLNRALQAPSLAGDCVILITVPYCFCKLLFVNCNAKNWNIQIVTKYVVIQQIHCYILRRFATIKGKI